MLAFSGGFTYVHPCIFALPQTIISSFAKPWEKNKMKRVRRISLKVILFFSLFFFFYNRPNFSAKNSDNLTNDNLTFFYRSEILLFLLIALFNVRLVSQCNDKYSNIQ